MKKIEAIIKPFYLEDVRDSLQQRGFIGMTVSEIRTFTPLSSAAKARWEHRSIPLEVDFIPCLKLEIVVNTVAVDRALDALRAVVPDSSSIMVQEMDNVVRIRTNERGEIAV